jgi:hypothetical protein
MAAAAPCLSCCRCRVDGKRLELTAAVGAQQLQQGLGAKLDRAVGRERDVGCWLDWLAACALRAEGE